MSQSKLSRNNKIVLLYFQILHEQRRHLSTICFKHSSSKIYKIGSNMDTRAFYDARKVIHVSMLAEVNETIENTKKCSQCCCIAT